MNHSLVNPHQVAGPPNTQPGFSLNCPPKFYVLKDKQCPYCDYVIHVQNQLTKHIRNMHDINYKSAWQLKREAKQARLKSTQGITQTLKNTTADLDEQEIEELQDKEQEPGSENSRTAGGSPPPPSRASPPPPPPTTPTPSPTEGLNEENFSPTIMSTPRSKAITPAPVSPPPPPPPQPSILDSEIRIRSNAQLPSGPYSIQFQENFKIHCSGASGVGKTFLIAQILLNLKSICETVPQRIVWVYCNSQPIHKTIKSLVTVFVNISSIERGQYKPNQIEEFLINKATDGKRFKGFSLLVFDDCQQKPDILSAISALFNGRGRHNNISLIYASQNLFSGKTQHEISNSANYLIIFNNKRFQNEASILNGQMLPGKPGLLPSILQSLKGNQYLFINLNPKRDENLVYLSDLFSVNHIVKVFIPINSPLEQ